MKRKRFYAALIGEALICVLLCIWGGRPSGTFTSMVTVPFEQIGTMLRFLSLSGKIGNMAALALYAALCLLPVGYLLVLYRKKNGHAEDGLLVLLSAVLFAVLYWMINPADIAKHFSAGELVGAYKALLGVSVYSIAAGYLFLRALRLFSAGDTEHMLQYLKMLLGAAAVVFVFGIFGSGFMGLIGAFEKLAAGNTEGGQALFLSNIFLVLQYCVGMLPNLFALLLLSLASRLADVFGQDPYSAEVVTFAQRIGQVCKAAVISILLSQIVINVLQLLLGDLVRSSNYTFSLPLVSVILMLVAMLFAKHFERTRALKADNDSII